MIRERVSFRVSRCFDMSTQSLCLKELLWKQPWILVKEKLLKREGVVVILLSKKSMEETTEKTFVKGFCATNPSNVHYNIDVNQHLKRIKELLTLLLLWKPLHDIYQIFREMLFTVRRFCEGLCVFSNVDHFVGLKDTNKYYRQPKLCSKITSNLNNIFDEKHERLRK